MAAVRSGAANVARQHDSRAGTALKPPAAQVLRWSSLANNKLSFLGLRCPFRQATAKKRQAAEARTGHKNVVIVRVLKGLPKVDGIVHH